MTEPIRVRVTAEELGARNYGVWETRLYEKLKAAGIPALPDGSLESGILTRYDDPADFGASVYEWTPTTGEVNG